MDPTFHPQVNTDLIVTLTRWVVTNAKTYSGAVLIFMPGLFEIIDLVSALQRDSVLGHDSKFLVLPLHSELTTEEQKRVFVRPPKGVTKLVVATNIAEASITIDDVTCVIDGGGHKEIRYDPHTSMTSLRLVRIAEANATQRAGRAGRTRAGVCFHLYMRSERLEPQQQPEVRRSPLEPLCLRVKALGLGSIKPAIAGLPAAPESSAIDHAMRVLAGLQLIVPAVGATATAGDPATWIDEVLSPLGAVLSSLPTSPRAGKVAVLGTVFGCLEPMLVIAAALDAQSVFSAPLKHRDAANRAKRELDPMSDHIAVLKAHRNWSRIRSRGGEERRYLSENFLSRHGMLGLDKTIKQLRNSLQAAGLLPGTRDAALDQHSDNMALVKALVASALYPGVATVALAKKSPHREPGAAPPIELRTAAIYGKKAARKANGQLNDKVVALHPSTVLHGSQARIGQLVLAGAKDDRLPPPLVVFNGRLKTSRDFVSDATLIGPMQLLLFAGSDAVIEGAAHDHVGDDDSDGGDSNTAAAARTSTADVWVTLDRWYS